MQIDFTEDDMIEFLLVRGYVLYQGQREVEDNVYQNVFISRITVVQTVFKHDKEYRIREAFEREFKNELINKLWQ